MTKNKYIMEKNKGFTLIELMLYVSLAAIILLLISLFLTTVLQARIKNQTVYEVEQQGSQILENVSGVIRNAKNINLPTAGNSSPIISLATVDGLKDPTIFSLSGNTLTIKEGIGSVINLSSNRVSIDSLTFTNISRTGTPGSIRVILTLSHVNAANRNEYEFNQTFYETVSLRQ